MRPDDGPGIVAGGPVGLDLGAERRPRGLGEGMLLGTQVEDDPRRAACAAGHLEEAGVRVADGPSTGVREVAQARHVAPEPQEFAVERPEPATYGRIPGPC